MIPFIQQFVDLVSIQVRHDVDVAVDDDDISVVVHGNGRVASWSVLARETALDRGEYGSNLSVVLSSSPPLCYSVVVSSGRWIVGRVSWTLDLKGRIRSAAKKLN